MYELLVSEGFDFKVLFSFLEKMGKRDEFVSGFGVIDSSYEIGSLYSVAREAKKAGIETSIIISESINLPKVLYIHSVDVETSGQIIVNGDRKESVSDIKAVFIHLEKKERLNNSDIRDITKIDDLFTCDVKICFELYTDSIRLVLDMDEISFHSNNRMFKVLSTSFKTFCEFMNFINISNDRILHSPLFDLFLGRNNYVKYFIYDTVNNKEIIWMIKTKQLNI